MATIQEITDLAKKQGTQFNIKLPGDQIVPAAVNPGEAATLDFSKGLLLPGNANPFAGTPLFEALKTMAPLSEGATTLSREEAAGQTISSQYPVTPTDPNAAAFRNPNVNYNFGASPAQSALSAVGINAPLGSAAASDELLARGESLLKSAPGVSFAQSPAPSVTPPDTSGTTAASVLEGLGINKIPTAEELSQKALSSPEFQLLQEKLGLKTTASQAETEAAKAKLDAQYASDKDALENKLAANGLAFSGIRATQVKALVDNLASSKLDLDRKIASNLLDANLSLKEGMLKAAADVIKDAQNGRKEALAALKDVGLTVVGNQVVPTLASQREARIEEQFQRVQERLEAQALEPSVSEKLRSSKIEALAKAGPALSASKGTDGFVDPAIYLKLRNDYVQVIGDVNEFDEVFSPMLSLDQRVNLGVGKTSF